MKTKIKARTETNLIHKAKIENLLRRKEDRPSSKDEEDMKSKLQTNKEIKKLIIRARDNYSSNKEDSAKTTLLKKKKIYIMKPKKE